MTCICLDTPIEATCDGYVFTNDGSWWIYCGPCAAHLDTMTVSPLWHPAIGYLAQDETAASDMAAVALEAMETV